MIFQSRVRVRVRVTVRFRVRGRITIRVKVRVRGRITIRVRVADYFSISNLPHLSRHFLCKWMYVAENITSGCYASGCYERGTGSIVQDKLSKLLPLIVSSLQTAD